MADTIIKLSTNKTFVGDDDGNAVEDEIATLPPTWIEGKIPESSSTEGSFIWSDKLTEDDIITFVLALGN